MNEINGGLIMKDLSLDVANFFEEGEKYYDLGDYAKAAEMYLKAAEQGDSNAQNSLGFLYDIKEL